MPSQRVVTSHLVMPIGGDHKHLADLAVDNLLGNLELLNHAEGDRSSAWLDVVHLPLEDVGVDVGLLGKDLGSARTGGTTTNDGDPHLAIAVPLMTHGRGNGSTTTAANHGSPGHRHQYPTL
eukprot:757710-Hanusia_phi.AAC.2